MTVGPVRVLDALSAPDEPDGQTKQGRMGGGGGGGGGGGSSMWLEAFVCPVMAGDEGWSCYVQRGLAVVGVVSLSYPC